MKKNNQKWFYLVIFYTMISYFMYLGSVFLFFKAPQTGLWIDNIYKKKLHYANNIKENKIIVLGGSSALFSVKASNIEKHYKIPVVNFGTNAGLGIDYLLDRVKRENILNANDIVIISFAYDLLPREKSFDLSQIFYMLTYDRAYFYSLPFIDKINVLSTVTPKYFFKGLKEKRKFKNIELPIGVSYNSTTLNKNGDETYNKESKLMYQIDKGIVGPDKSLKKHFKTSFYANKIDNFISWCNKKNIKIIVMYPGIPYFEEYNKSEYKVLSNEINEFYKTRNVQVIGSLEDSFYDKKLFYDSMYHMNNKGAKLNTEKLINNLSKYIQKCNKNDIY